MNQHTNPAYRWVALAIVLAGAAELVYGIISWRNGGDFGMSVSYTQLDVYKRQAVVFKADKMRVARDLEFAEGEIDALAERIDKADDERADLSLIHISR